MTAFRGAGWLTVALAVACGGHEGTRAPHDPTPGGGRDGGGPTEVTVLYTADEHGWVLPHREKVGMVGGAADLLGTLVATEKHCPGQLPDSPQPPPLPEACKDPSTLLVSGGDNYTGPAISSYFRGRPMAEAMARMGYAASAFGNHEFDFGRDQFVLNRARSRVTYLAANVHVKSAAAQDAKMPAFATFDRRGVRIGVVGLATDTTLTTAMASHFDGIEFEAEEPALERAIPEAWSAGADALVLVAHECPDVLVPIVARHPEWRLSFVGAGHCHKRIEANAAGVPVVAPGWRLEAYVRVRLTIDKALPARRRVVSSDVVIVDTPRPEGAPPQALADVPLTNAFAHYEMELDRTLGERIGYSGGMEKESPAVARWIAASWRAQLRTDVAIVNSGGIRQGVPKGAVTLNTIYSVMPFDNRLMVCKLSGRALLEILKNDDAVAVGVSKSARGYVDSAGRPINSDKSYTVATIDYLYYGGANFTFKKHDPAPKETGLDWRAPVIDWTKKQRTSEDRPIETRVP